MTRVFPVYEHEILLSITMTGIPTNGPGSGEDSTSSSDEEAEEGNMKEAAAVAFKTPTTSVTMADMATNGAPTGEKASKNPGSTTTKALLNALNVY